MSNVLAIDQGTSGTKAVVVCPERGVIASATVDLRPRYGPAGEVEQDPQALLDSVLDAGRRALAAAGEPVIAVGLANQGETVLAWDPRTGTPLTPAIGWQDRRAAAICHELADDAGWITDLTGLPLDPYFAAPKLAWLRRTVTREGVATTSDAWLVHRLTGQFVTDASTASRTGLLDLDRTEWSPRAAQAYGLADERLPAVVDCAGRFGETTAFGPAARGGSGPAGSGPALPLTGLVVDQQAALLAQRCLTAGAAKCTYGTGAFLLAQVGGLQADPRAEAGQPGRAVRSAHGLPTSVAWRLAGASSYCLDGQIYTVASAVRWLVELGVLPAASDLDRVAEAVPDAGGVVLVPALAGLAAPHWAAGARGAILGAQLGTTAGHLARALVDGIAGQVVDLATAVAGDLGAPLTALRVDGGLTRSRVLMQTQADLLQLPVEVYASADATALGAAALARVGATPGLALADAIPAWTPAARYEPAISADQAAARLERLAAAVAVSQRW
jgi:glycerol kinase